MADVKISELPALTSPDGAEELVVNDGGTTKKITITNATSAALPKAGGTMTGALVVNDTVTADGLVVDGDGLLYSASNVEMRGSANVRISLGTAGTSGANNSSNWVYGNGTNLRFNNAGGFYSWETLGTERMRLSSGNLIVGATAVGGVSSGTKTYITSTGNLYVASSGEEAAYFNRNSNDGSIVEFRKNNATVGSIGVANSGRLYIGSGDSALNFDATNNAIYPWNATTNGTSDSTTDLGISSVRFKDAYLSGGVYLGGTGSANKLSDYETGSWTPTGTNFTVSHIYRATYVKVGSQVTVQAYVTGSAGGSGTAAINGLPFTSQSNGYSVGAVNLSGVNPISNNILLRVTANNTVMGFLKDNDQGVPGTSVDSGHIIFTATYFTDS